MKKLILTLGLIALVGSSAFAQGAFIFQSRAGAIWDDWSGGNGPQAPKRDNTNYVAFLIGHGTPLIASYLATTPTNQISINVQAAWTDLLTDPNYQLCTNVVGAALIEGQTSTLGAISILGGSVVVVSNTAAGGGTISIIAIAWSDLFGTNPFAAAAAGSPVGWSVVYDYNYAAGPSPGPEGTPENMSGFFQFGVQTDIPEPTTFALAGLSVAAMLVSRRKQS